MRPLRRTRYWENRQRGFTREVLPAQFCSHIEIRKHIPGTRRQRRTMTILSIRTVGDPVLRSVCDPITSSTTTWHGLSTTC